MNDKIIYLCLFSMAIILHTTLLAMLRPFKRSKSHYTLINIIFVQILNLLSVSANVVNFAQFLSPQYVNIFVILTLVFASIPLVYGVSITSYAVYSHRKFGFKVLRRISAWKRGYANLSTEINEILPDRLENSRNYHRENLSYINHNQRNQGY